MRNLSRLLNGLDLGTTGDRDFEQADELSSPAASRTDPPHAADPKKPTFPSSQTLCKDFTLILYDLETTGLGKTQTLGITEIGAVACVYTNDLEWTIIDSYHSYVLPAQNISPDVPNGLTKQYLLKNNAKPFSRECGPEFKRFVEKHSSGKPALLCAHNGKRYDHRILCHHGWDHSGWAVDSLQLFKDASPGRNSYSLKNLHTEMFGTGVPAAHNAMPDVHAMLRVFNEMNVTPVLCVKHAESWECVRARVSKSES